MSRAKFVLLFFGGLIAAALCTLGLAPASAHPGHEADAAFRALLFTKTAGLPARLDPRRHHDVPAAGRGQQLRAGAHRGLRRLQRRQPRHLRRRSSCSRPPAWCGTPPPSARRWRATWPAARASSPIHNATDMGIEQRVPVVGPDHQRRRAHAGALPRRRCRAPPSSPTRSTRRRRACRTAGSAARSGTTSTATRAATCTCWSPPTSAPTTRARARWAPTTRSPGAATPSGGRVWATAMGHATASYSETELPQPRPRRRQVGGRQRARRLRRRPCGATSRRSRSTTTPPTRWRSTSRPTAGSSTSSAAAR